jgi:hypothetical protein
MIKGIDNKPYINLDPFLDIDGFKSLHPEICKGFALARDYAKEGTWMAPGYKFDDMSYTIDWKPIYQAFNEYQSLPDDHPIKIAGKDIFPSDFKDYKQRNLFTRYLKSVLGANDPYIYYFLWEEGDWNDRNGARQRTPIQQYFPGVVSWVENLVDTNIISQIGRVIFFLCDHNGKAFEHRDLDATNGVFENNYYTTHRHEFIHIRYRTKRGFYIWDPDTESKFYINSNAAFWNDEDWHGGDHSNEQEYGMRVDCVFTDEFRKKLGINHLTGY